MDLCELVDLGLGDITGRYASSIEYETKLGGSTGAEPQGTVSGAVNHIAPSAGVPRERRLIVIGQGIVTAC
jgi:hypothetical protein